MNYRNFLGNVESTPVKVTQPAQESAAPAHASPSPAAITPEAAAAAAAVTLPVDGESLMRVNQPMPIPEVAQPDKMMRSVRKLIG